MENKEPTINDIVLRLSTEMVDDPDTLSKYLVFMTAHLYKYGKKVIETEVLYVRKWEELRSKEETDGRATMLSKATQEYQDYQMAKVNEKTVLELIRSIKKRLTSLSSELNSY